MYKENLLLTPKTLFLFVAFSLFQGLNAQSVVTLPTSGAATAVAAGATALIYDNGGATGNYSNSVSGYVYLTAQAGSTITISGSYNTESSYDFFKIISGNGTGGIVRSNVSGASTWFTYTGTSGEGLTIQLTSDGSTVSTGLKLLVTYSTTTTLNVPATGNNSVTCGSNTVLFDNGGRAGAYSASNSGYTVLNNNSGSTAQIRLMGTFYTESGFDFVKIFNGTGTGGTLLASFSGSMNTNTAGYVIDYTGAAGQTLTVQFVTDGTTQYNGFEVAGLYSGSCSVPAPTVSSFTPTSGCAGITSVTITGTNFTGATAVKIGGTNVSSYTVNSATQITATIASGTTGTVSVTTASGTGTSSGTFTVNSIPTSPTATGNSGCKNTAITVSASGAGAGEDYKWYDATGVTLLQTGGSTYTTPMITTTTNYLVSKYNTSTLCESSKATVTATVNSCYVAQIQSVSANATSAWCPGETRTITVTIKNAGTLPWTDGGGNDFNIGVKWNTNGANWADYYVRVDAQNLAAGATTTYNFTLTASNATAGPVYGTALSAGTNNLTFDVVKEGDCWFGNNTGGCGIGNSVYTTSAITILATPATPTVTATNPLICGQTTTLTASHGTTLVPSSGNNSVECGYNVLLQDHAGNSNYSTNVDGYTVLKNSGTGTITINGSYVTEASFDFIYIYNGVGTGGTQVTGSPFSGTGNINVTGTAGQALTVRFLSDGSTQKAGFNLNVTYSGTSCGSYKWYDASTGGTLLFTGANYSVTPASTSSYYCEFNNLVCSGPRSTTTITVNSPASPSVTGTTSVLCGQTTTLTASHGTTLVPSSGNNSVECGYNVLLQDHAGNSNYSTNVDGYTVLKNSGTGAITINGSYTTEAGYDYIYIYNGVGTGGTQVAGSPFSSNTLATINVTGTAGQAITVRFTSDGGTQRAGFDLNVTYSNNSCGTYKWYDASTGGTLLSTGAAYTTPIITANTTYYAEFNNGTCSSSRTTSAITVTANPPATPVVSGSNTICPSGSGTYTATAISGATYTWTLPSGWSGSSTTNIINVTAGSAGGTISVTATTICGTSAAGSKVVSVSVLPTVNAGEDQAYCGRNILSANTNTELVLLQETFETVTAGTEITPNSTGSLKIKTLTGDENWSGTANVGTKWYVNNSAGGFSCAINNNSLVMKDVQGSGGVGVNCDYFWGVDPPNGSYDEMDQIAYLTTNINANQYSNLAVRFSYKVSGDIRSNTAYDYMQLVYSTDGGTTWNAVSAGNAAATTYTDNLGVNSGYSGTGTGSTVVSGTTIVTLPSTVNGSSALLIGFRWRNDDNDGYTPGLVLDDIYVTGTPGTFSWSGPGIVSGSTTALATINAPGTYTLTLNTGAGCAVTDNVVVTAPALSISSTPKTDPTLCGATGTLTINANPSNTSVCDWFSNTFSSTSGLSLFGSPTPVAEDGRLLLTRAYGSKSGGIVIPNSSSFNAGSFKMEFDLFIGAGNSADGFSISYAGDIGSPTAGTEGGHGTGLVVTFDSYNNLVLPANEQGVRMTYGGAAVGTASAGTAWRNTKQHVYLYINSSNQLTLKVGATTIFNNQALPAGYGSANKTGWTFALSSRTGGAMDEHAIANLAIVAYNQFEYSINGTSWQASNAFTPVAGTYTPQVRPKCSTSCGVTASNVTLVDPSITANAFLATTSNSGVTLAIACQESGWTYYADPADLTKWLFGIYKNGNVFTPTVTINVKSSGITAYDKVENTTAKKAVFTMGRYWNVVQGSMTGSNPMKVRFFYDPSDLSTMQTAANTWASSYPTTYTHAVEWFKTSGTQYNPGSNTYVDVPTSSAYTTAGGTLNGITYIEYQNVNSFSGGTAGIRVSPGAYGLPVKLIYLTASAIDNSFIRLDWATSLEIDNKGFDIERSTDGIHFDKVGWIDGNGNSTQTIKYKFDDKTVLANTVYYYRLKQIDYDGDEEYSNIVSASIKDGSGFTLNDLYPNPATDKATISISTDFNQDVYVKVFDLLGQIILDKNWQVITGTNKFEIDLSSFASGTYTVSLFTGNQYLTKKLVVSR